MPIHDLIRRQGTSLEPRSPRELITRYQQLRAVCRELNKRMMERLTKDILHEGGRKLGLLRDNVFVFNDEVETAVLSDYCLYYVRRRGCNVVEQYYRDNPPAPGTDERVCLHAMRNTIHSLFRVDEVEPDVALAVTDLATDDHFLLVDIGFSESAEPGLILLTGLLQFDDFAATRGAPLVMGMLRSKEAEEFCAKWKEVSSSRDPDYDPGPLIRELLQGQETGRIRYRQELGASVPEPHTVGTSRKQRMAMLKDARKPDASRRCPCGSGKMFKNCCQKKQR